MPALSRLIVNRLGALDGCDGGAADVGRLPMPAPWVLQGARSEIEGGSETSLIPASAAELPETRQLIDTLLGERPVLELPAIRLLDGRRVRLLAIESRGGVVEFLCRTERPTREASRDRASPTTSH